MKPGLALCRRQELRLETERGEILTGLEKSGFRVREIADGEWDPATESNLLVAGNLNWFPKLRRQLLERGKPAGTRVAIWHTEPLPPPDSSGLRWPLPTFRDLAKIVLRDRRATDIYTNYFLLRALARKRLPDVLAVSTRSRLEFLQERGIRACHLPLGYEPACGDDLDLTRDIDVFFLGDLRVPRRKRLLADLRAQGIAVRSAGDWSAADLWGEARTKLLNRVRIFLNLQRFPGEFSGLRFLLGMANGALVLSEPVHDPHPFAAGEHFVSASLEEMPSVIRAYLNDEEERRRIARAAHRFVTTQLRMDRSVTALADMIAEESPVLG